MGSVWGVCGRSVCGNGCVSKYGKYVGIVCRECVGGMSGECV